MRDGLGAGTLVERRALELGVASVWAAERRARFLPVSGRQEEPSPSLVRQSSWKTRGGN